MKKSHSTPVPESCRFVFAALAAISVGAACGSSQSSSNLTTGGEGQVAGGASPGGGEPGTTGGDDEGGVPGEGGTNPSGGRQAATGGRVGPTGGASVGGRVSTTGGRSPSGGGGTPAAGRAGSGGTLGGEGNVPRPGAVGYYVDGVNIYDRCGERVVLRGVNHPTLFVDRAGNAFPEIAKTGANTVRLFWAASQGVPISELEAPVKRAIETGLIPMVEMHDSTCKFDLDPIVDYWTSPEAVKLIERYQENLLVNIANEPSLDERRFAEMYTPYIKRMRDAGIHTPIVIDSPGCGRRIQAAYAQGAQLLANDPDHNLIFAWHVYDTLTPAQMTGVLEESVKANLPIIIGEFANKDTPGCGGDVAYSHLMAETQRLGIGWYAWSWGDNSDSTWWNADCWEFDMTRTFSFDSLERWGKEAAVDDPNSLLNTSVRPYSLTAGECR